MAVGLIAPLTLLFSLAAAVRFCNRAFLVYSTLRSPCRSSNVAFLACCGGSLL